MRKLYATWAAAAACCLFSTALIAQRGPSAGDGDNVRTKTVRDCEYEVLPGLAEVTSIEVIRSASESALKYDEHEVLFKFTPMEGGDMLEMLQDTDIDFVLRSRAIRIPVGPEYLKQKNVKVGTKYAMNLLQTRNREACLERYTYESKALDNDLFEAYENIIEYTKKAYEQQLEDEDRKYQLRKAKEADGAVIEEVDPIETPVTEVTPEDAINSSGLTPEELAGLTEAEMRELVEKRIRERIASGDVPNDPNNDGINERQMRAEIEAEKRKEFEAELTAAGQETVAGNPNNVTTSKSANASDAIREAKRKAKDAEREAKAEEKREEQLMIERQRKEQELRIKLEAEVEAEIRKEIEAKKEEQRLAAIQQAKADAEAKKREQEAVEKMKSIEQELAESIINETKRKDCAFNERVSGVIEVIKVSKVKEANLSTLKYTEYEVVVSFRPDNYAELSKKDKKLWDETYVFTLDPKGKNANPGASYIRKYKVFKASKYQGFAETLQSGICNEVILFAPELPNDASKINLK